MSKGSADANASAFRNGVGRLRTLLAALNSKKEEVRIWIPATSNFGHLASSILVLYRFISFGAGIIRVVYVDKLPGESKTTWQKLQMLILGLPDKPVDHFTIQGINVFFTDADAFEKSKALTVTMGITGGWDGNGPSIVDSLRVHSFCCLQPYLWGGSATLLASNALYFQSDDEPITLEFKEEQQIPLRAFYIPDPVISQGDLDIFKRIDPRKALCVSAIRDMIDGGFIDLVPVYFSPGRPVANFYDIFFNLICGIIFRNKTYKLNKPTVIVMLADTDKENYPQLRDLLNGKLVEGNTSIHGSKMIERLDYLREAGYFKAFKRVALLDTPELCTAKYLTGDALGGNYDIVLAALGNVPSPIFNYLYSLTTLVHVFEGMGTASLALNLGKAFYHLESPQAVDIYRLPPLGSKTTAFSKFCNANRDALCATQGDWQYTLTKVPEGIKKVPPALVGEFIDAAVATDARLQRDFLSLRAFYHDEQQDKLLNALIYMLEFIEIPKKIGVM